MNLPDISVFCLYGWTHTNQCSFSSSSPTSHSRLQHVPIFTIKKEKGEGERKESQAQKGKEKVKKPKKEMEEMI